jgi:hypothetical protein
MKNKIALEVIFSILLGWIAATGIVAVLLITHLK